MELDAVLDSIQEKDPIAWEILSICSALDCSLPIPIWIFLQPSSQLVELPDDAWGFSNDCTTYFHLLIENLPRFLVLKGFGAAALATEPS
jgi:hypothetical protein